MIEIYCFGSTWIFSFEVILFFKCWAANNVNSWVIWAFALKILNMCVNESDKKNIAVKESIGYECAVKIHPIIQKYILFFATASS